MRLWVGFDRAPSWKQRTWRFVNRSTSCDASYRSEPPFTNVDRSFFAGLYGLAPGVLSALAIVKPKTVIRWHRAGFRSYWRWKPRPQGGRPKTGLEVRQLIREMSVANPLWGAPRIHGELLKLGIDIGQTTVAKYMARERRPPSQGWKTFLRNHADGIASITWFRRSRFSYCMDCSSFSMVAVKSCVLEQPRIRALNGSAAN